LVPLLEYLMLDLLYSGHSIFWVLDGLYYYLFDLVARQGPVMQTSRRGNVTTVAADWENPMVCGRNRRPSHTPLRAFSSGAEALAYWNVRSRQGQRHEDQGGDQSGMRRRHPQSDSVVFLSDDVTRSQDAATCAWEFCLVGGPDAVPLDWHVPGYLPSGMDATSSSAGWVSVSLPGHWQLDPVHPRDVPIYTNTSYPFRFDPPFVNRDGHWKVTLVMALVLVSYSPYS
jgi:hypothetical protein